MFTVDASLTSWNYNKINEGIFCGLVKHTPSKAQLVRLKVLIEESLFIVSAIYNGFRRIPIM
jgi:hypothetical protein